MKKITSNCANDLACANKKIEIPAITTQFVQRRMFESKTEKMVEKKTEKSAS